MEFKDTQVFNFEGAFRGMRNPLESWDKSDSFFGIINWERPDDDHEEVGDFWVEQEVLEKNLDIERYSREWEELWEKYNLWLWNNECLQGDHDLGVAAALGPKDLALAQKLVLAGSEHCKFMRQIFVSVDITAPIYWWKEFDTYKIGTAANSTSTMHKLTSKPITIDNFETEGLDLDLIANTLGADLFVGDNDEPIELTAPWQLKDIWDWIIEECENLRQKYLETRDKRYWKALVQFLPEAWLQKRTVTVSYANLRNIYFQRRNHKLSEWHLFCDWISQLPYAKELIMLEEKGE